MSEFACLEDQNNEDLRQSGSEEIPTHLIKVPCLNVDDFVAQEPPRMYIETVECKKAAVFI